MSCSQNLGSMYQGFVNAARSLGFDRSAAERRTLRDRVTVTVATDVGSASQPFKASFFSGANSTPNRAIRSQDPKILDGSGISKDTIIGIFGVGLRFQHGAYAGTLTETEEVIAALSDAVLELRVGTDVLCELTGAEMLYGDNGFEASTDAAGATTARTSMDRFSRPFILEWARIVTDQAQLGADLYINKTAWTTNDNFNVFLELLVWVSREGSPSASTARVIF